MRFFLLFIGLSMSLFACQEPPECDADTPCDFGSVCKQGACSTIGCATSAQCDMEQFCATGACTAGCEQDDDCYPGDHCNLESGACESSGCTDTRLDCGYKEFCNEFSGECYDAGGYYCKSCNDDFDCGGNGNYCTGTGYCGVTCESDTDCPSGFSCSPFVDINGNVVFYQCFTYCWLYDEYEKEIPQDNATGKSGPWPQVLNPELPTCSIIERAIRAGVGQ